MARVSRTEDKNELVKMLKGIKESGGYRRLESPLSYFMVRRLRDKGLVTLVETEKTAVKGKKPSLYVLTPAGNKLVTTTSRVAKGKTQAKAKTSTSTKTTAKKTA